MAKSIAIEVFRVDTFARFDVDRLDDADRSLGHLVGWIGLIGCLVASMLALILASIVLLL